MCSFNPDCDGTSFIIIAFNHYIDKSFSEIKVYLRIKVTIYKYIFEYIYICNQHNFI
jgi:hypothetical protein